MNTLYVRHYLPAADSGASCEACGRTSEFLQSMVRDLSPKLANLNIRLVLQNLEMHQVTEANCGKLNYVSFFAPEMGLSDERSLETILGAPVSFEDCEGCSLPDGKPFPARTLSVDGHQSQAIPPGMLTDALIRVVFSAMGGCSGSGCASCKGCGDH